MAAVPDELHLFPDPERRTHKSYGVIDVRQQKSQDAPPDLRRGCLVANSLCRVRRSIMMRRPKVRIGTCIFGTLNLKS
jgi:hypothetical protein